MVHHCPFYHCAAIVQHEKGLHAFFSCFEKRETTLPFPEQFISLLDKTPCYIYPTKIADDILPAATLSTSIAYGPVNHTSFLRTEAQKSWNPQRDEASYRKRRKEGKWEKKNGEELRNLVGTNSYFLCWLAVVIGSRDTQQNEWNYWAFIKQTAGPLWRLKAAAKHSPPVRLSTKIARVCMKDTAREIY